MIIERWQNTDGKIKVLGEKPVLVPLCPWTGLESNLDFGNLVSVTWNGFFTLEALNLKLCDNDCYISFYVFKFVCFVLSGMQVS